MAKRGARVRIVAPERIAEIVVAYQGGKSACSVGAMFGFSETKIVSLLGEAGVEMRKPGRSAGKPAAQVEWTLERRIASAKKAWRTRKAMARDSRFTESIDHGEDRLLGHQAGDQDPA